MEHGTQSEIHAVATLTGKVLPFFSPGLKYIEEGAHVIYVEAEPFILVSPDGSVGHINMESGGSPFVPNPLYGCEFKCPSAADFKTPVHYEIPIRYIPQVLSEMVCLKTDKLWYLCWTEESSTIIRVRFDENLWLLMLNEAKSLYKEGSSKRPTRTSALSKEIKTKLHTFRDECTEFICEVPSIKATACSLSQTNTVLPYVFPVAHDAISSSFKDIAVLLSEVKSTLKEAYEICRRKASEVLVWLLSDTDRNYNPEVPNSIPIAYAMKGYSLTTTTMRAMHSGILQTCHEKNVDVLCSCLDGQWIKLATRDINNNPLTLLQLQRDVWDKARKETRDGIISKLSTSSMVRKMNEDVVIHKSSTGSLSISCAVYRKVLIAMKKQRNTVQENDYDGVLSSVHTSTDVLACLPDEALDVLIESDETAAVLMHDNENADNNSSDEQQTNEVLGTQRNPQEMVIENSKQPKVLSDDIFKPIVSSLKIHPKASVSKRWKDKTFADLKVIVQDSTKLQKLTHDELNIIIGSTVFLHNQTVKKNLGGCKKSVMPLQELELDIKQRS
ncbi:unnamed protein product [Mytilus edulis]|uniref:YqaJ viral recombinase domain-containing protein n=1 Tax=Mytilus edulis TaxID=6550 RepID=A0A8S3V4X4_MYTED|nr:unnamed protein product [Mytilus edulis]